MARGDDNQVVYVDGDIPQLPLQLGQLLVDSSEISPGTTNLQQCTSQDPLVYEPVQGGYPVLAGETGVVNTNYYYGDLRRYGATMDGVTDDTASTNAAFQSGQSATIVPAGTGVNGKITAGSAVTSVTGTGTLKQLAEGTDLLELDGNDNLSISGIHFLGASSTGLPSAQSGNTGLTIKNARSVIISGCRFERWRYFGLYLENCQDVIVTGNTFYQCALPFRLRGCNRVTFYGNVVDQTNLAAGVFTVGVGLDSTDGHALGVCNEIVIAGNTITDIGDCQGILVHAGTTITIAGNTIKNCAAPISVNPYNTTDFVNRVVIDSNSIECATAGTYTNSNDGIVVQGGPASGGGSTPDPTSITISNNVIVNANRVMQHAAMAGIRIGFTKNVAITGNVLQDSYGNGIYLADSEDEIVIDGNVINSVVAASGVQRGIYIAAAGSSVVISSNNLSSISGGTGIDIAAAGKVVIPATNSFNSVTTPMSGGSSAQFGNAVTVTAGTTLDLGGYDTIVLSHAAPTTVNAFTNVVVNKIYTLTSTNGNTTIDRTNAFLDGGTNKTFTADDVMLVMGISSNRIRQVAPMSVNS